MNQKELARTRRHTRIRKSVAGTPERPRLSIHKSLNNIYAQVIDDVKGHTLISASSLDGEFKEVQGHRGNATMAKKVGMLVARKSIEAGIGKVVFDRGGYKYHGCVKALAEGAREGGLQF